METGGCGNEVVCSAMSDLMVVTPSCTLSAYAERPDPRGGVRLERYCEL